MKKLIPAFLFLLLILCFAEFLVRTQLISAALVPAPTQVLQALSENASDFAAAFQESLLAVTAGWILSALCGAMIAFIFSLSRVLKQAILPFAVFFQTVPIIAIAPLLVIYFGFGMPTVIAASFIVSLFPIIANSLVGLESPSVGQIELFRIYQASKWDVLVKLRLPSSYPYLYSGLKISAGLSVIGAVAGEFVAGGGLGAMIDTARTQQRVDIVFAALLLLSLMGLLLLGALKFAHILIHLKRPFSTGDL